VIIDAHVHWKGGVYPGDERAGAADLFDALDSADVTKAVVVGLDPHNEDILRAVTDEHRSRLAALINVHPFDVNADAVRRAVERADGFGETYIRCGSSQLPVEYFRPVLDLARSTARPILLHTGDFSYTAPAMMADMVSEYPNVVFVLGHSGSLAFVRDAIEVAKAFPNTYLETSGMTSPAMLRRAVDELGAERILFGSDYPFWHPAVERARIDSAGLEPAASRLILGENARRLFDF